MRSLALLLVGVVVALAGSTPPAESPRLEAAQKPFPDFGFLPPPSQYTGRFFKLSQNYPAKAPPASKLPAFLDMDFQKDWKSYLLKVRDYCFEGNLDVDWRVEDNTVRPWYHVPWQHYGPTGREAIHGLTKEASLKIKMLAPTQTNKGQTYAVGFYNEFGGYAIGQTWKDHLRPHAGVEFPHGTVICKVLFTDLAAPQVPSLVNPMVWEGYISDTFKSNNRSVRKLALIQMDLMVRDHLSPHGWVFGTFQYNGALNKANSWDNLVPVGLQWGNDPDVTDNLTNPQPVKTLINVKLKESVINDSPDLPPTHLGWGGRLNGPVDHPGSACMSCHLTAEAPMTAPMAPFFKETNVPAPGSAEWMRWFQNLPCGRPFDKDALSTDFSLQVAQGIQAFHDWEDQQGGLYAGQAKENSQGSDRANEFTLPRRTSDNMPIYKIQRSFSDR